jgi:hypothetical protein
VGVQRSKEFQVRHTEHSERGSCIVKVVHSVGPLVCLIDVKNVKLRRDSSAQRVRRSPAESSQFRFPNGNTGWPEEGGIADTCSSQRVTVRKALDCHISIQVRRQHAAQDGGLATRGERLIAALAKFVARAFIAAELYAAIN